MRIGFFGDVVGRSGREGIVRHLPGLRRLRLQFVVVNAENAAGGFGITESTARELFEAGADCLTLGNHSWDQREALTYIVREERLIRPLNYPRLAQAPGRGAHLYETSAGQRVLVTNLLGQRNMEPILDDPFSAVDRELEACPLGQACDAIVVDMHGDVTSEKMAMGHFCDGRASLVVGSHSHVPTADAQVLPGGTAYQTDAGACADYDSVIGNDKEEPLRRFTTRIPSARHKPAEGPATVCGVFVETDARTGLARRVEPIRIGGRLIQAVPEMAEILERT